MSLDRCFDGCLQIVMRLFDYDYEPPSQFRQGGRRASSGPPHRRSQSQERTFLAHAGDGGDHPPGGGQADAISASLPSKYYSADQKIKCEETQEKLKEALDRWKGVPDYENIFHKPFREVFERCNLREPIRVRHDERVASVSRLMTENQRRAAVVDMPSDMPTILEDATDVMEYKCVLIDFNDINHAINLYDGKCSVRTIGNLCVGDIANISRQNATATCTWNEPVGEVMSLMARKECRRAVIFDEEATIRGIFHLGDALTLFAQCEATREFLHSLHVSWVPRQENIVAALHNNVKWAFTTLLNFKHSSLPVVSETGETIGVIGIRDLDVLLGDERRGDQLLAATVGDLLAVRGYKTPLSMPQDSSLDVMVDTFIETRRARIVLLDDHKRSAGMVSSSSVVWMVWPLLAARIEKHLSESAKQQLVSEAELHLPQSEKLSATVNSGKSANANSGKSWEVV